MSRRTPTTLRTRRAVVAVIGSRLATRREITVATELGCLIVEHGWRLVTGGLGGVMEAASRGAHRAKSYAEGDVVALLPGDDPALANPYADIVLPTGMGHARNVLVVAMADVVVAAGGKAGTLSEIALAWQFGRPIVGLDIAGWSRKLAGSRLDEQRGDQVWAAADAQDAVRLVARLLRPPAKRGSARGTSRGSAP